MGAPLIAKDWDPVSDNQPIFALSLARNGRARFLVREEANSSTNFRAN
jgi:hypothetical protein